MIERAIENWLINTNERNYQIPFCEVLALQGHRVLYISKHGQLEQGKDVITVAPDGAIHAYQLKTGDISLATWRKIAGEIQELIEIPIVHASIPSGTIHKSFLVCNGQIDDTVRLQISQRNQDNTAKGRNYSYLETVELPALVKDFIDSHGSFLPQELADFSLFLTIFNYNGKAFLPKEKFVELLESSVFKKPQDQKAAAIHCISSSVLVTSYVLKAFQHEENHYALFEAWSLLLGQIFCFAKRQSVSSHDIDSTILLVRGVIEQSIEKLIKDALSRKYLLEGDVRGDGGVMVQVRRTIILGVVCGYETRKMCRDHKYQTPSETKDFILRNVAGRAIWGEGSFPFYLNAVHFLELIGNQELASTLLYEFYTAVLSSNNPDSEASLPSPYDDADDVLRTISGLDRFRVNFQNMRGRSYVASSLVEILARRGKREVISANWKVLTNIRQDEVRFQDPANIFAWRSEEAINHSTVLNPRGSWSQIEQQARCENDIPVFWKESLDDLRLWLLVSPHRTCKEITRLLDLQISKSIPLRSSDAPESFQLRPAAN